MWLNVAGWGIFIKNIENFLNFRIEKKILTDWWKKQKHLYNVCKLLRYYLYKLWQIDIKKEL